jgi:site-specific DNA-methyltransferase (adenine-specific)
VSDCIPLNDPMYPPHDPVPWKRREQIGLATLYLGDCREIAPTLERPAAVISDPPYGINGDTHAGPATSNWRQYDGGGWDRQRPPSEWLAWMGGAADYVALWGGNYFADVLPPTMGWLVWDKGQTDFSLADCELAWTNRKQALRRIMLPRAVLVSEGGEHPTQKPIAVMRFTIDKMKVPPAGTILDPYMGSGSTGVAAVQMRHPFVGIEIEPRYFDVACRRIEEAQRQGDMFRDAAP